MKIKIFIPIIIIFFFFSERSFSQGMSYYFTPPIEFRCNNNTYTGNTKGLQQFLDETTMENDLKIELTEKLKVFKRKKRTSQIVGFGLAGAGIGYILYANSKSKGEEGIKSSDGFKGFGLVCSGVFFDVLFGNKRKDYQNFLDTYNEKSNINPIIISANINYTNQLNGKLVIKF